jgi:hypothetical protein
MDIDRPFRNHGDSRRRRDDDDDGLRDVEMGEMLSPAGSQRGCRAAKKKCVVDDASLSTDSVSMDDADATADRDRRRDIHTRLSRHRSQQLQEEADDVPTWRYHLRAFFFPKEHRAAMRRLDPRFSVLAKNPDWFEMLSLVVIIANMVALTLDDPTQSSDVHTHTSVLLDKLDTFFVLFFFLEACVRLLAFGVVRYWSDHWNRLDAVIVVSGVGGLIFKLISSSPLSSITVLRALRVLRPLRSVTKFASVRLVVSAIVSSMRRLVDVTILFLLFFMCFSAAAVAQYSKHLRKHCVNEAFVNVTTDPLALSLNLTAPDDYVCGGRYDLAYLNGSALPIGCSPDILCGTGDREGLLQGFVCPYGYSCELTGNPNYGFVGFDNIGQAVLTIQVMVTMSSWTEIMFDMMDSTNVFAAAFCTVIIFIGTFFIVNLIVAIVTEEFERSHRRAMEKLERERETTLRRRVKVESYVSVALRRMREYAAWARNQEAVALRIEGAVESSVSQQRRDENVMNLLDGVPGTVAHYRMEEARRRHRLREEAKARQRNTLRGRLARGIFAVRIALAQHVVRRRAYDIVTGLVMVANAIILSCEHYRQPQWQTDAMVWYDYAVNAFLTLELLLRFVATHPFLFLLDWPNSVSVPLVCLMWLETALHLPTMRFVRLLRVMIAFPLLKVFPSFYRWIEVVLNAFRSSLVLVFVILLNLFIFATLGMQLYGGLFCGLAREGTGVGGWCENRPRSNFDAFGTAMLTAFQIMTSDAWQYVMYDAMKVTNPASALLFVLNYFISVYLLNNLFIAILLNARTDVDEETARVELLRSASQQLLQPQNSHTRPATRGSRPVRTTARAHLQEPTSPVSRSFESSHVAPLLLLTGQGELISHRINILKQRKQREQRERQHRHGITAATLEDNLGVVSSWLQFRRRCVAFAGHRIFQYLMTLAIIGSTLSQMIASPVSPPDLPIVFYLFTVDAVCTALFCLEAAIFMVGYGVIFNGKESYLRRSWWNVLDLLLAIIGVADLLLLTFSDNFAAREVARGLFPLRPLRILRRAAGIRVVLGSIVAAIPSIKNILILSWILWFLWGIIGVQLFAGSFYSCSDKAFVSEVDCLAAGAAWLNAPYHFDNIGSAMTALYVITTFSDWTEIAFMGVDSVGPGQAPVLNHNPLLSVYFLVFAVIGGIFFVNLFVSVLIDTYEAQRKKTANHGSMFLTAEQNAWMVSHRSIIEALPPPSYHFDLEDAEGAHHQHWFSRCRHALAIFVQTNRFVHFINLCIILNFIVNAMDHYPIDEKWDLALLICNSVFTMIFLVEIVMKIFAFGPRLFATSKWNLFDLIVVIISLVGVALELVFARRSFGSSFRTLRLIRLLRLVKSAKRVQRMIVKLGIALYALNNVAALIVVVTCVFALTGMRLFGRVVWDMQVIDHNANFTGFLPSVLIMLQLATLDNWNEVMTACSVEPPNCNPDLGECGSFVLARMYFISTTWLYTVVLLNIFVAVIIDTFTSDQHGGAVTSAHGELGLTEEQITRFVSTWMRFDPKRTLMLKATSVIPFLMALPPAHPFAMSRAEVEYRQALCNFRYLFALDLTESAPGYVDLWDVLSALCRTRFSTGAPSPAQLARLRYKYKRKNPRFILPPTDNPTSGKRAATSTTRVTSEGYVSRYADGRLPVAMRVAAHLVLERFRMARREREEKARAAVAKERELAASRGLRAMISEWAKNVAASRVVAEAEGQDLPDPLACPSPTMASVTNVSSPSFDSPNPSFGANLSTSQAVFLTSDLLGQRMSGRGMVPQRDSTGTDESVSGPENAAAAESLLGSTSLFVQPSESFIRRHPARHRRRTMEAHSAALLQPGDDAAALDEVDAPLFPRRRAAPVFETFPSARPANGTPVPHHMITVVSADEDTDSDHGGRSTPATERHVRLARRRSDARGAARRSASGERERRLSRAVGVSDSATMQPPRRSGLLARFRDGPALAPPEEAEQPPMRVADPDYPPRSFTPGEMRALFDRLQRRPPPSRSEVPSAAANVAADELPPAERERRLRLLRILGRDEHGNPRPKEQQAESVVVIPTDTADKAVEKTNVIDDDSPTLEGTPHSRDQEVVRDATAYLNELLGGAVTVKGDHDRRPAETRPGTLSSMLDRIRASRLAEESGDVVLSPHVRDHRHVLMHLHDDTAAEFHPAAFTAAESGEGTAALPPVAVINDTNDSDEDRGVDRSNFTVDDLIRRHCQQKQIRNVAKRSNDGAPPGDEVRPSRTTMQARQATQLARDPIQPPRLVRRPTFQLPAQGNASAVTALPSVDPVGLLLDTDTRTASLEIDFDDI